METRPVRKYARVTLEYDGAAGKQPTGEREDGVSTFQTAAGLVAGVPRACGVTSSTPTGSHGKEDGVESWPIDSRKY